MTLTLVDTAGASNATTFASLATAEDYVEDRPFGAAWTAETDDDVKTRALLFATQILDTQRWAGTKASSSQALSWPRRYAPTLEADADPDVVAVDFIDESTSYYDETTIPLFLERATCELALALLTTADPFLQDAIRVKSKTIGPLATEYFDSQDAVRGLGRFPHVMRLISHAFRSETRGNEVLRA